MAHHSSFVIPYLSSSPLAGFAIGSCAGLALAAVTSLENPVFFQQWQSTALLAGVVSGCFGLLGAFGGLFTGLLGRLGTLIFHKNPGSAFWTLLGDIGGIAVLFLSKELTGYTVLGASPVDREGSFWFGAIAAGMVVVRAILRLAGNRIAGRVTALGWFAGFAVLLGGSIFQSRTATVQAAQVAAEASPVQSNLPEGAQPKFLWAGVDGASWDLLLPLARQGKLPVMGTVMAQGRSFNLWSLDPMRSPLLWTTAATGKLPEKHGIQHFVVYRLAWTGGLLVEFPALLNLVRIPGFLELIPVSGSLRRCRTVWDLLSEAGFSSTVLGWWATWPAEPLRGLLCSDRAVYSRFNPGSSGRDFRQGQTSPEGLLDGIQDFIKTPLIVPPGIMERFFPDLPPGAGAQTDTMDQYYEFRLAWSACETYRRMAVYLQEKFPSDLLFVYFEGVDNVSHFFYKEMIPEDFRLPVSDTERERFGRVVPQFYRLQDAMLGDLLVDGPDNLHVLITSDHGFRASAPGTYDAEVFQQYPVHSGTHQNIAVGMAAGPEFQEGKGGFQDLTDLTPLILQMYGIPPARDLDGTSPASWMTEQAPSLQTPIATYEHGRRAAFSEESPADELLREKFRGLGYLGK